MKAYNDLIELVVKVSYKEVLGTGIIIDLISKTDALILVSKHLFDEDVHTDHIECDEITFENRTFKIKRICEVGKLDSVAIFAECPLNFLSSRVMKWNFSTNDTKQFNEESKPICIWGYPGKKHGYDINFQEYTASYIGRFSNLEKFKLEGVRHTSADDELSLIEGMSGSPAFFDGGEGGCLIIAL